MIEVKSFALMCDGKEQIKHTGLQRGIGVGLPDLANEDVGNAVQFEFQISNKFVVEVYPIQSLGHTVLRNYWLFI